MSRTRFRVWIHSETRTWHDKKIQLIVTYQANPTAEAAIRQVFFKISVFKNLTKWTENTVSETLSNKVTGLSPATWWKKRLRRWCFSLNFAEFLRTSFSLTYPVEILQIQYTMLMKEWSDLISSLSRLTKFIQVYPRRESCPLASLGTYKKS